MVNAFVKAAEIWTLNRDNQLCLSSAYYGEIEVYRTLSETRKFNLGEGLPGTCWSKGQPMVLPHLDTFDSELKKIAMPAGINSAVGVPILCGEFLLAVVVLFCADGESAEGAVEVWHNRESSDNELQLTEGFYGLLEKFEWVSRRLTIMRGRGLPGLAWSTRRPMLIEDLGQSNTFLRASHAIESGVTTGLSLPFFDAKDDVHVLTFLAARATPTADRFEVWRVNDNHRLEFDCGYSASGDDLKSRHSSRQIARGEGVLGQTWLSGMPRLVCDKNAEENALLIIPVIDRAKLESLVCLYL